MSKKTLFVLVSLLVASALLGSSLLTRGHFWGDDFAAYISQARSILGGTMDEYVTANTFTVTRSSHAPGHQMGPTAYPWGFPLMLVPVYALVGISPLGLKLPVLATYLAFLVTFFFLMRRRFTPTDSLPIPEGVIAVSLFAFNPELLHILDNIISDIPFLFLSTLAILVADIYAHKTKLKYRLTFAALTGFAIFIAFFVRTQGLLLLGSFLLFQGIRFLRQADQRRQIMTDSIVSVAVFGSLWGLTSLIFPGGQSSYLSLYTDFNLGVFRGNLVGYSKLFGEFFATVPGQGLVFGIFAVLFFIGLFTRFKTDLLFALYMALYLIVIWTWPEWQGYRFIFPMLPFFIYFAFQGIKTLFSKIPKNRQRMAGIITNAFLFLIIVTLALNSVSDAYQNLHSGRDINGPFDPFSLETYNFIKDHTPQDSIIVFFKPRMMALMTDRLSLALTECDRITEGDYLVLSKKVGENLQIPPENIGECGVPLEKAFENRRFIMYRVIK